MTSFASAWLATALTVGSLGARPDSLPLPDGLVARVAARIAESWGVPQADVHLSWPRLALPSAIANDAEFRLAGRGSDGWFVVVVDPSGPRTAAIRVRAGVAETLTVAARPLTVGGRIARGDVRDEPRVMWGPPRARDAERPGVGWEIRRALATGEVVAPPAVMAPPLIASGETVRLIWKRGGVDVSLAGVALNAARRGERLRVRVEGRSAPLMATAAAPATATLDEGDRR